MRRISLIFAMIALLVGIPVQAQKKARIAPIGPPIIEPTEILLRDDNGGGYLLVDLVSGAFKCEMCEYGLGWGGTGTVKIDGCAISFSIVTKEFRIFANANVCKNYGECVVDYFNAPPVPVPSAGTDVKYLHEYWVDGNLRDNKPDCIPTPTK